MKTIFALSALVVVASAARPPSYAPSPYKPPTPSYAPAPSYKEEPANYQYEYAVKDDYAGVDFGANEYRNGYSTNGGYNVLLPDGRRQVVTYNVADAYSGYVADVQYEGYATAPSYKPAPAPYKPAPAPYKPAPAPYKPAPVYKPTPYKPTYN